MNDAQCDGCPCVRGMLIRITDLRELLGTGASFEEVLEDNPYLEREDILASINYAARETDRQALCSA